MFISTPKKWDVITGRGNVSNVHAGNIFFRDVAQVHKSAYFFACNDEKKQIISRVIELVKISHVPPGRFLTDECGVWKIMDEKNMCRKVGQALREQQSRQEMKVTFGEVVQIHKSAYFYASSDGEKKKIISHVIELVQDSYKPPGKFVTNEGGVWELMDQRSIDRKVGQALRVQLSPRSEQLTSLREQQDMRSEQQMREEGKEAKEATEPSGKFTWDNPLRITNIAPPAGQMTPTAMHATPPARQMTPRITNNALPVGQITPIIIHAAPPRIINVAPPVGQMKMSSNQNSKRRTDDFISGVQSTRKIPRLGENDPYKDKTQQCQIGVVKEEMAAPPKIINVAPPVGQMKMSSNQNSKRRTDDFISRVQSTRKIPRLGEVDPYKDKTQQFQIGVVKEEMALLRKEISLLWKRVAFLEKRIGDSKKMIANKNDRNWSEAPSTPSSHIIPNSGIRPKSIEPSPNSSNCRGKFSPGQTQVAEKSFCAKPSLRSFSQALVSSIRGISKLDNAEDALFDILTKLPEQS